MRASVRTAGGRSCTSLRHGFHHARRRLVPSPVRWPLVAAVVVTFGAALGLGAVGGMNLDLPIDTGAARSHSPALLVPLLTANLGAVAMLYSGVAVAGITTALGLVVIGLYAGTVLSASVHTIGWSAAAAAYAPFVAVELAAFCAAATAGLLPSVLAVREVRNATSGRAAEPGRRSRPRALLDGYLRGADGSLVWLALAVLMVLVAAVLEVLGGIPT